LGISRLRRPLALSMSALSVAAAIYAFYSPQSFYWYTASIPYTLPVALLTIYMALAIRMAPRWRKNIPSLLGVGAVGFLVAGFSEMYLVFQLTLFTFCLLMSLAFLGSSVRSRYAPLIGAGWLGTLASLLVQLSSPGGAIRAEVIVNRHGPPDRSASHLLFDTLEQTFGLARHAEVFVGLMMLMGVGLLVMLIAYQPPPSAAASKKPAPLALPPLWLGLIFQLLFIPLLWSHTSDNPQLLGRFSIRYMVIITLNIISILGFLVMLWQRGRINTYLQKRQRGWLMSGCIMAFPCLFALLFFIPQIRNIDYRAAVYLFTSVHVLLAVLTWQLSSILESAAARGLGLLALGSYGIGWASITAIIFAANFATPWTVFPRTLSASAWLLVFSGLIWGVYMGYSAQCLLSSRVWTRLLKLGSFAAVLVIAAGILGSQVALAPDFQLYAQEWEEFHQEVIAQRDSGKTVIEVEPFTFDLAEYLGIATLLWGEYDGAEGYYKVESIAAKDS